MLRLVKEPSGKLVNKWIPDFELEKFKDDEIIGPAMVDTNGEFVNGDWLDLNEGKPVVSQAKKDAAIAIEAKRKTDAASELTKRDADFARMELLGAKSRTLAESNELIDLHNKYFIGIFKKFNLIELLATTKRKD